jgi:hypothetical protein
MKIDPTLLIFCAAVILSGMFITGISLRGQVYAQGTEVDVEKLKQILNATRTALEANDLPGALTQLDMADEILGGGSNVTATGNMTNTTATMAG